MAAVTISSDFGAQEHQVCHCFPFFPFYLPWSDGTVCYDFSFLMLSFKPAFTLFSFTFKSFFSSSSLSAIFYISEIVCISPGNHDFWLWFIQSAFPMIYLAYKLKKQACSFSFPNFEPLHCSLTSCNCCFLTCRQVFQEAGKVIWYSHLYKNFPRFVVIHTVKGFSVVNEAEVDVFLEFSWFFYDPTDVGNLISDTSAFSKRSLYIWKFSVHILLKPTLKHF